ncbi:MAG: SOS response-associated peptidase [Actinomycetota bacterium]|nr:SOS response-associated peptidase [Actinomycetota bacterium]
MCGRYVNAAASGDLTDEFDVEETVGDDLPPSWNVAPTDPVRMIVQRLRRDPGSTGPIRQLRTARWGLVPSWSKSNKSGAKMINARLETVTAKPAFKAAAARRRCLLPALGYFEWQATDDGKIPHFLHDPDGRLLAMAGLYELWPDPGLPEDHLDRWLWTCTVITQPATDLLGQIHDRCPVVVPRDMHASWLNCASDDPQTARRLLDRIPEVHLQPVVVSTAVNSVRNNGPELIDPARETAAEQPQLPL